MQRWQCPVIICFCQGPRWCGAGLPPIPYSYLELGRHLVLKASMGYAGGRRRSHGSAPAAERRRAAADVPRPR